MGITYSKDENGFLVENNTYEVSSTNKYVIDDIDFEIELAQKNRDTKILELAGAETELTRLIDKKSKAVSLGVIQKIPSQTIPL